MKKLFLFVGLISCTLFAQRTLQDLPTRNVNNCVKFNVLGIVQVWSGTMDVETFNPLSNQWEVTDSKPCGKSGGSWDWFWE